MKLIEGQTVYIGGDSINGVNGRITERGGYARLEQKLNETSTHEWWLVYFLDHRTELSQQRLFEKDNMPTPTKEKIMATRKKAAKKTAKKAVKKVVTKAAPKKSNKKPPLSRFVCDLLIQSKFTDAQIAAKVKQSYPKCRHNDEKVVHYYRNFINLGKMAGSGFEKPKTAIEPIGGTSKTEVKKTVKKAAKKAVKKAAKKAVKKAVKKVAARRK